MHMLAQVDAISETRARLMAELDALPRSLLAQRSTSGGWSILEVIEHLVLSERSVLANMDRPELLKARRKSLRARFGLTAVMSVLRSPIPVSVPSADMRPKGERSFEELRTDWEASHEALRGHVAAVEGGQISGAVFMHPIAGPLTTREAIRMLRVHLKRHEKQIRNILQSLERGPGDGRS